MHRCTLGIGIEAEFCGKGLGTELLQTILTFARQHACLHWIELGVFHANLPARALYRKFGFVEAGVIRDKFRIAGVNIDDVIMTLAL